jgi:8-oxo-dGTP pyrophosphatase MutT (NUDIX family)
MAKLVKVILDYTNTYLFLKKSPLENYSSKYPGKWELPGGKTKTNEHPETTAIREVKEETGINIDKIHLLYKTTQDQHFDKVYVYYAKLKQKPNIKLSKEHTYEKFLTYKKAIQDPEIIFKDKFIKAINNLYQFKKKDIISL